jgi:hypothetical protein
MSAEQDHSADSISRVFTVAMLTALFTHPNHVGQTSRYGLARWQLRRAFEYFEQHLSDEVTALSSSQSQHLQEVDFLASRQHYIKKYEAALNKLGK